MSLLRCGYKTNGILQEREINSVIRWFAYAWCYGNNHLGKGANFKSHFKKVKKIEKLTFLKNVLTGSYLESRVVYFTQGVLAYINETK